MHYVNFDKASLPAFKISKKIKNWKQEKLGLITISHMKDVFVYFH